MKDMGRSSVQTLTAIAKVTTGSYIAGGYLRDSFLGMPYNDVDVFIPLKYRTAVMDAIPLPMSQDTGGNYTGSNLYSYRVASTCINLIFVDTLYITDYIRKSFDITLCMIWYSLDTNSLYLTKEFKKAVRQQCITIRGRRYLSRDQQVKSAKMRVPKLQDKYPTFSYKMLD